MKAGEIRKERTHRVLPLRLREEGWGRKRELVCPIERGKKWLLRSRNLKFSLKFSKRSKTSIYR